MNIRSRWLVAGAAICVSLAAISFAQRWFSAGQADAARRAAGARVDVEVAAIRSELAADKLGIIARVRELQSKGDDLGAMRLASRYRLAEDADIQAAYSESVRRVSDQQAIARSADLVAKGCIGIQAIAVARTSIAQAKLTAGDVVTTDWRVERVDIASHLANIRDRLRQMAAAPVLSGTDVLSRLRGDHLPRYQAAAVVAIMTEPDPSRLLCMWRVAGVVPPVADGKTPRKFDMMIWFGPSATERTLEHDVLSVAGL